MSTQRLPPTDSISDLAHFWDTHDVTEFENELDVVNESVFERDTKITLDLAADEVNAVHEMAKSRGVGDAQLIREWILDRLHAK